MPYIGVWRSGDFGHMLSCQGITTDAAGNLISILLANGDDARTVQRDGVETVNPASLSERYVKWVDGKILLYKDKACQEAWLDYYIGEVSYINTPQVLQNMLAEYRNESNEAQVWNGAGSAWEQQNATTDELPTEATGWDVHVNGSNIAAEHQGYYHTYATEGRAVLFDDHAAEDKRTVTINGTVSASSIEVAAAGYTFQAGNNAAIQAGADLTLRSAASLHSELELQLNNLTLENRAALASTTTITVKGNFLVTLHQSTTISLLTAAAPGVSIAADLNLSEASSVSIEATVDMNNRTLTLRQGQRIELGEIAGSAPIFANVGTLIIGGQTIAEGTDLTDYLVFLAPDNTELTGVIYGEDNVWVSIPEPTTATLSLLALAALTARRRRR
ncbi:MAG: PEP-CTERM sorting domain-containing protein [Akkermansiaceae bacterium]|nr:PEP-CTERM sorting domain-containing protein [Akkermansiaceae bacterium]